MITLPPSRRVALALGPVAAATALAACGPNATGGSGGGGDTSLRMTWWGSATRTELTDAVIAEYEEATPGVTIETEPAEFSAYWDKLATQTAAQDSPDIIQFEESYLAEYAERGALLDLASAGLDTSGFTEGLAAAGALGEAGQVGVRGGSNAPVMLVNTSLFDRAGVDLPDDTSWTWDEFLQIAEEISAAEGDGVYGATQLVTNPVVFRNWMRQRGAALWTDRTLGFAVADAQSFFEFAGTLLSSPGAPESTLALEDFASPLEQSLLATGRQAMSVAWSNQAVAISSVLEDDLAMMRMPSAAGSAGDHQMWLKPGVFWSVAASSDAPEAAVAFLNHLLNSPEAGSRLGVERGVPPNTEVRELVKTQLEGVELATLEYVEAVTPEVGPDPEIAPRGGSVFESLLVRTGESFLSGDLDAAGAAQQMVDELGAAIA